MKTTICLIIFSLLAGFSIQAQEMNRKIIDERFNKEILIGFCDREGLQEGEFGEFFDLEYKDYEPQQKFVKKLRKHKKNLSIVMVIATWCPDCQEQVPRFYKILDEAGGKCKSIKVICVDGQKSGRDVSLEEYNIDKVPTFIFYRKDKEIGRITEAPGKSLEEDFYDIVM